MMNNSTLVGRLTKDPELKYTQGGIAVTRFTLAVNRSFANAAGEREADFIQIVVWRKQAENVANFLRKGSLAGVTGRIQTSNFEGQDGKTVYVTEVVAENVAFLDSKGKTEGGQPAGQPQGAQQSQPNPQNTTNLDNDPFTGSGPIEVSDDDLPF